MTIGSITVGTAGALTNGATTQFSFSFSVASYGGESVGEQLEVKLVTIATGAETTLAYPADFSVSVNGDQASSPGGSITTTQTYASGYRLFIRLAPLFEQHTDLQAQGAYNANTIEAQFDHLQRQINVLRDRARRAPRLGIQAGASFEGEVEGAPVAGYGLYVKNDLSGYYHGAPSSVAVSEAMAAVVQAATYELASEAFGVMELWAEWFGASPDEDDNAVALQAWIDRCAETGKVGRIGPGVFEVGSTLIWKDGARVRGSGCFSEQRVAFDYPDSNPTVIKNDGTITGTNSCVLRVSATAVGVAGTDFSAPGTHDLQDIDIRDIHIDANGAEYAAVYYRCGNGSTLYNITHGGATVAGAYIVGAFATAAWELGAYNNNGRGFLIGQDTADTSYGNEAGINDMTLKLRASQNGKANAWSKFHATDQFLGCGVDARIARGSRLDILSENNVGRGAIIRVGGSTGGYSEVNLLYLEGNGDGVLIDYEDTAKNLRLGAGFLHTGNGTKLRKEATGDASTTLFTVTSGATLTASQIEVYVSGVRKTPTTDYTVADNGSDLDVTFVSAPASGAPIFIKANKSATLQAQDITIVADTADGGPTNPDEWLVLHDISFPTTNGWYGFINSNTYKFRVERCSTMYYAYKRPLSIGAWQVLAHSNVKVSHTGDTDETVLATITIPAGALGANGRVRLRFVASTTESANVKTVRVRYSGISGTQYIGNALTNQETCRVDLEIGNRNSQSSQIGWVAGLSTFTVSTSTPVTSTVDTSAETTLLITGQLASSGETIAVESYVADMIYGA